MEKISDDNNGPCKDRQTPLAQDEALNRGAGSRGRVLRTVSIAWVVFLAGFIAAVVILTTKVWPYPVIDRITAFVTGHADESTSLLDKIRNDLDIVPTRHLESVPVEIDALIGRKASELTGLPLKERRRNPEVFLSEDAPRGYRAIYGVFDFKNTRHGVILLDPDGSVANFWQTTQEDASWPHGSDANVYPHGFAIGSDGSIVIAYDASNTLTKYDWCGNILWRVMGGFHHTIELDERGVLWTLTNSKPDETYGNYAAQLDYMTGEVLDLQHLLDAIDANPGIDIFEIFRNVDGKWLESDPGLIWHINDVEPLPERLAPFYPQFNAGDLLISFRQPNLVYVMDPETLKVKWWRQGLSRKQHDPDWNDRGTITIFNNNSKRGYSNILELDPVTMTHRVVLDGRKYAFTSDIRGKHQMLPDGGFLVTSSMQGRVFEVGPEGDIRFEFLNPYGVAGESDETVKYLSVSEARFLSPDYFKELPSCE